MSGKDFGNIQVNPRYVFEKEFTISGDEIRIEL